MNYLAHLLLAEQCTDGLVGALMGDFVKGPVPEDLPPAMARGIRLHRAIDRYTDQHPLHRQSRGRFVPPRRRFAGIIVDLCYDHFLVRGWPRYAEEPLDRFCQRAYAALEAREALLPKRLREIAPRMRERDWLGSYGDIARVGRALDGVASRVRRGHLMLGAIDEVEASYQSLEADFHAFFPQLARFVDGWPNAADG